MATAAVALFALAVIWPAKSAKAADTRGAYNTFLMSTGTYTFAADATAGQTVTNTGIGNTGLATAGGTGAGGIVEVARDSGMAFMINFAGSAMSASGTNYTVTCRFGVANTLTTNAAAFSNVSTNLTFSFRSDGANQVKGYAYLSPLVLNNVKAIKLLQVDISGGTNAIYLTNVVASKYFPVQ